ncbi:MAG: 50S ribosomal protein L19e [Candidatus Nanoarchaeia archaeon]
MELHNQKILAAKVAGVGVDRVVLVPERISEIKDAITKTDIRSLIKSGAIKILPPKTPSRVRAKAKLAQRRKSRRRGHGSRKGAKYARLPAKTLWMRKIRLIRTTLKRLKNSGRITQAVYKDIYAKAKGGFFRDKGHMFIYLQQNKLMK